MLIIFVTASSKEEAKQIANALLEEKLCACVNIIDNVESLFWWNNKINSANEVLLMIKTKKELFQKLEAKVKSIHSYEVPEIIAMPIVAGNQDYLDWIKNSLVV